MSPFKRQDIADCYCDKCKVEFYGDAELYQFDGLILCEDCVREEIDRLPIGELMDVFGFSSCTAESQREEWGYGNKYAEYDPD